MALNCSDLCWKCIILMHSPFRAVIHGLATWNYLLDVLFQDIYLQCTSFEFNRQIKGEHAVKHVKLLHSRNNS